jgi:hypothetical protein
MKSWQKNTREKAEKVKKKFIKKTKELDISPEKLAIYKRKFFGFLDDVNLDQEKEMVEIEIEIARGLCNHLMNEMIMNYLRTTECDHCGMKKNKNMELVILKRW